MFKDKILLITGGTGSFGNAVLRRFLDSDIKEIRIFSRDEKKQDDLRNYYKNNKIKCFVGDVREYGSVESAMYGVDYVFHAAALKQVPSCEFFPMEAVRTNVIGTENVLNAAIVNGVEKVICLSTDKAVYPINAMGMSKAMMEKVASSKSKMGANRKTVITITRYGNVMASRGSVIPLFTKQIKTGQAITVTDPNMTRFMMTLDDAVDLVLFAFENARGGELFVQKAPAATIEVLAEAMKAVFQSDVDVKCIGTRHGEKLYESLLTREEKVRAVDLGRYFMVPTDDRDLNYGKYFVDGDQIITEAEDYTSHNTDRLSRDQLEDMLLNMDYIQNELEKTSYSEGY
ncbi:UDP-glucose 4-epimerase [Paenibacillus agaridevorans]|uniref:UDP-glucose 4-epimerase n=1 Tax=Paenibacillus agaridevorans TaxID=171404 RepID=A0A2R5EMT7_9BACL|nr:polysaccharide biosynthesis protein [Paenibacillus agaridevorans]GBG07996.1 UDP-glucose 4-epimerase [Paenibacillus agaridevorans]